MHSKKTQLGITTGNWSIGADGVLEADGLLEAGGEGGKAHQFNEPFEGI